VKIRIKFSKTGNLKYIGHLDVMRCFQKILRRAEVDVAYTAGFSPHQIMSFASPLGLGLTSQGEYVDIEVHSTESSEEMIRRINAVSVEGIEVLSYVLLPDKAKTAMSMIAAADYRLTFDHDFTTEYSLELQKAFCDFLAQKSITITKQTKKQVMDVEIRPAIYQVDFIDQKHMFMQLEAGSVFNLKPEQVMDAFCAFSGYDRDQLAFHLHRLEMYANLSGEGEARRLVPLEAMGQVIQ